MNKANIKWRRYQERVLNNLENYLENDTIHLVAPPGSGKTLLGVEIIAQVQCRTLVLVPSLILKNQWLEAIRNYDENTEISSDLENPKEVTVSTYQEVFSKLKEKTDFLQQNSISFLVLDEAHHLKNSWSELLLELKEGTHGLQVLALTATPPFDANIKEWQRYIELNGAIDEEISVSELIKEKVLAPYQDQLFLIPVTKESANGFSVFIEDQNQIIRRLRSNESVTNCLLELPFITQPLHHADYIYKNFETYLSCLFYLNEQNILWPEEHWQVLGLKRKQRKIKIPPQTRKTLSTLYSYLFKDNPELEIFSYLTKKKWLYDNKLKLFPAYQTNTVAQNVPQLKEAICQIVLKEERQLADDLCGVILLDRIKAEVLAGKETALEYGVAPVFLQLTELVQKETEIAAICGDFLIVSQEIFESSFQQYHDKLDPSIIAEGYRYLKITEKDRASLLAKVTQLLNEKWINLLTGTVSLLAEGWNCPAINTIILGNKASSYVQTQQIRGRGMRQNNEEKLTNIWHLGLIFPDIPLQDQPDLAPILKRLEFIEGLNLIHGRPEISTGSERFDLPEIASLQKISSYTQQSFDTAMDRSKALTLWAQALANGSRLSMPIFIREKPAEKNAVKQKDEEKIISQRPNDRPGFFASLRQGELALYFSERKRVRHWLKACAEMEKLLHALAELLMQEHQISTQDNVLISYDDRNFSCELQTASYHRERIFTDNAKEFLEAIDSPRYLLTVRKNIYSVPAKYGRNKEEASRFLKAVQKSFPRAKIIYTRNTLGRQKLIEARFTSIFSKKNQEISQQKLWH